MSTDSNRTPSSTDVSDQLRVLVVEDMEMYRMLMGRLCKTLNLWFEAAENGQAAVDFFKQGRRYDLVLMDKEMPVMDGHEATRQLRSLGMTTPIVAVTSDDSDDSKHGFLSAGANGFHTKPLSADQLVRLLETHVDAPTS